MSDHKFVNLKFKIYGETDKEVKAIIKPLEKFPSVLKLKAHSDYLAIMKYLLYMFDPNTDLNLEFVRLEDRQDNAGSLAGLLKSKDFALIKAYEHEDTLDVIHDLLNEVFFDIQMREWHILLKELTDYNRARLKVTDLTDKKAIETRSMLRQESQRVIEEIKQFEQVVFGDHTKLKDIAYKSRFFSPESFAKALKAV